MLYPYYSAQSTVMMHQFPYKTKIAMVSSFHMHLFHSHLMCIIQEHHQLIFYILNIFDAGGVPNDGDLIDMLLDFAPEEAVRKKILVDNPARLFDTD